MPNKILNNILTWILLSLNICVIYFVVQLQLVLSVLTYKQSSPTIISNKHTINVLNLHAARWHTKSSIILIFSMITFHVPICTTALVQPTFCAMEMQFLFTDGINLVGSYPQGPLVYITYNDLWSTVRSTWKEFWIDHMRQSGPVLGQTPTTR